jgi:hypothetical protein
MHRRSLHSSYQHFGEFQHLDRNIFRRETLPNHNSSSFDLPTQDSRTPHRRSMESFDHRSYESIHANKSHAFQQPSQALQTSPDIEINMCNHSSKHDQKSFAEMVNSTPVSVRASRVFPGFCQSHMSYDSSPLSPTSVLKAPRSDETSCFVRDTLKVLGEDMKEEDIDRKSFN